MAPIGLTGSGLPVGVQIIGMGYDLPVLVLPTCSNASITRSFPRRDMRIKLKALRLVVKLIFLIKTKVFYLLPGQNAAATISLPIAIIGLCHNLRGGNL